MALFGEQFPYTNFHDLNLDWILQEIKKFNNDYGNINDFIQNAIDKYLDDHPDYNIEDDSITTTKLNKNSLPIYNVADYGILPDTGDNYRDIHALIKEKVSQTGGILYFPRGKYTTSFTIFIPENTVLIGDGEDTEIYFDQTDTSYGVCVANAGSNVTIKNIKISQLDTGVFAAGTQVGCIGFSDISVMQCQEPPYSHNYIRESNTRNLTAENVFFSGKYPIQCEPTIARISNVVYRNLISSGTISVQSNNTPTIENVIIENCICDFIRISVGNKTRNICINNCTVNALYISNASDNPIELNNIFETTTAKHTSIGATNKNMISGNMIFNNCVFNVDSSVTICFEEGAGIHVFNNCKILSSTARAWIRAAALAADTNYSIFNDCEIESSSSGTASIIIGYGKNNKISGLITWLVFGDMHFTRSFGNDISSTNPNTLIIADDRMKLHVMEVVSTTTVFTFPSNFNLPFNTNLPVYVTLFNYANTNVKHTWAKIVNNAIVIQESLTISDWNRCVIDTELYLTRTPTPPEVYSTVS